MLKIINLWLLRGLAQLPLALAQLPLALAQLPLALQAV